VTKTKERDGTPPFFYYIQYHQKIHSGSFGFYSNGIMEGVRLPPLSVSARAVRWSDDDHRCYMTPNGVTNPHGGTVVGRGRPALQATTSAPPLCPPFPVSEEKREERRRKEASIARWSLHMYGMISPLMPPITHINISVSGGCTPSQGRGVVQSRVFQC